MVDLSFYRSHNIHTAEEFFAAFLSTLQNYYDADYYVDWQKVFRYVEQNRVELFMLSSLCRAPDKERAARELFRKYPQVIPVLPTLIANADRNSPCCVISLAEDLNAGIIKDYDFSSPRVPLTDEKLDAYVEFLLRSGVLALLERINSVFDYVIGVEVGLDSNARKNRSGKCAIEALIQTVDAALKHLPQIEGKAEATCAQLASKGCVLPAGFKRKKLDWAFWTTRVPRRFVLVEVNHYGTVGSKPESITAEYIARQQLLNKAGIGFIWITDGRGWRKMDGALREAFANVPYLTNIHFAKHGYLEWALGRLLGAGVKGRQEHAA